MREVIINPIRRLEDYWIKVTLLSTRIINIFYYRDKKIEEMELFLPT